MRAQWENCAARKKCFNNNSHNLQFNHNKINFIFLKKKNLLMRQSKGQPHFEEKSTLKVLVIQINGFLSLLVYRRWPIWEIKLPEILVSVYYVNNWFFAFPGMKSVIFISRRSNRIFSIIFNDPCLSQKSYCFEISCLGWVKEITRQTGFGLGDLPVDFFNVLEKTLN